MAAEREAQELGLLLQQQLARLHLSGDPRDLAQGPGPPTTSHTPQAESSQWRAASEEMRVRERILLCELASCEVAGHAAHARGVDSRRPIAGQAGQAVRVWHDRVERQRVDRELECEATVAHVSSMLFALHEQTASTLRIMARELEQTRESAARLASMAVTAQTAPLQLLKRQGRDRMDGGPGAPTVR